MNCTRNTRSTFAWLGAIALSASNFMLGSAALAQSDCAWNLVSKNDGPPGLSTFGMAYDSARGVAVHYGGGWPLTTHQDTWEFNGTEWNFITDAGPGLLSGHKMAYDSAREVTVLFGGWNTVQSVGDTWEWDGSDWHHVATDGPSERVRFDMAYDSARQVTVLFGGQTGSMSLNDTWEWDGKKWTAIPTKTTPPARNTHSLAYDSARGVVVLFGGAANSTGQPPFFGDTWEYDGNDWTLVAEDGPAARHSTGPMAYDSARGVTILFGGDNGLYLDDTWEWDGNQWQEAEIDGPSPRALHLMVYDSARNATVLYGGWNGVEAFDETWEYTCPTAEFFIADGDVAGLIAAIHAANAEPDLPATIHLAENGTYTLTEVDNLDFGFGPTGLPTITTEITINGNGATIERSSEDGTPDFRILLIIGPVEGVDGILTLNDATITGGQTPNGAAGIALSGTVTVVNCTISNNSAGLSGGGIGNAFGGVLTVIDSTISGNWATVDGGGIKNFSHGDTATIINSVITGNETAGPGGGIDNRAIMTLTECTISDNFAAEPGGGIANLFQGTLAIIDCVVTGNESGDNGGGIRNFPGAGQVDVLNTTIANNSSAGFGGGIGNRSVMTVTGCTITGNFAFGGGGGIGNADATAPLLVTDSVVSHNSTGGSGGGLWSNTSSTQFGDTAFCENDPDHTSGPFIDLGGNTFRDACELCLGDLDNDGNVDVFDLLILLGSWGACDDPDDCPADLNGDGEVTVFDLLVLLSNWGACP